MEEMIDWLHRCGDLNVSHQSIDLANPKTNTKTAGFTQEEREDFSKLLNDGFIDSCKTISSSELIRCVFP